MGTRQSQRRHLIHYSKRKRWLAKRCHSCIEGGGAPSIQKQTTIAEVASENREFGTLCIH